MTPVIVTKAEINNDEAEAGPVDVVDDEGLDTDAPYEVPSCLSVQQYLEIVEVIYD